MESKEFYRKIRERLLIPSPQVEIQTHIALHLGFDLNEIICGIKHVSNIREVFAPYAEQRPSPLVLRARRISRLPQETSLLSEAQAVSYI